MGLTKKMATIPLMMGSLALLWQPLAVKLRGEMLVV
jgi:hypothetical protein